MTTPRLRVLVVEDEMIVSMMLVDMLGDLGHEVVGTAACLDDAMRLAETAELDVAMLDLHLSGQQTYPVAEVLRARGLRFVFATGYGGDGLPATWRGTPTLQKPFMMQDLEEALAQAVAGG